jgi:hypothetical protein
MHVVIRTSLCLCKHVQTCCQQLRTSMLCQQCSVLSVCPLHDLYNRGHFIAHQHAQPDLKTRADLCVWLCINQADAEVVLARESVQLLLLCMRLVWISAVGSVLHTLHIVCSMYRLHRPTQSTWASCYPVQMYFLLHCTIKHPSCDCPACIWPACANT